MGPTDDPLPPMEVGEQRWSASLVEPHLWPHRVDFAADEIMLLEVNRHRLRRCVFLDGREQFWRGSGGRLRLSRATPEAEPKGGVDRFIFHVGFCGSTLLSGMIDRPGAALVLREPRIVTDVAAYRAGLDSAGDDDDRIGEALALTRLLLRRRWSSSEATIVKPSNWANNLIPQLCVDAARIRPLFLSMERRSFVRAVLRGGPERLAFAARAALHFSVGTLADAETVAVMLRRSADRLQTLTALAALAHRFQMRLFNDACELGGWSDANRLSFEELVADPTRAIAKAAAALDIDAPSGDASCLPNRHSKDADRVFSREVQDVEDARIEATHGFIIDRALEWNET